MLRTRPITDLETTMKSILLPAALSTLAGIAVIAWADGELARGWQEVPEHWWSSLAALPAVAGLALFGCASVRRAVTSCRQ
jgi:hypothetical protein